MENELSIAEPEKYHKNKKAEAQYDKTVWPPKLIVKVEHFQMIYRLLNLKTVIKTETLSL